MTPNLLRKDDHAQAVKPGTRLELGTVCATLKVSVSELAEATALSRTAAFNLLTNQWPARIPQPERERLRERIEALLGERGATAEQIAIAWHPHINRRKTLNGTTDAYGRPRASAIADQSPSQSIEEPEMLFLKPSLTPAARRHFKLVRNPFGGEVQSEDQFFAGDDFRYVRESALQCALNGGFVAVVGESGAGKTTVLADLEARLQLEGRGVIMIKPGVLGMDLSDRKGQPLKSTDILHSVITTLQPEATVPQTLQARTVKAGRMLTTSAEAGADHLLVIEEAHSLPDATLTHLKRLHELRLARRSLLGILLLAQPELKVRLANGLRTGALREVSQRCEIVELLPLMGDDLRGYIECRLTQADTPRKLTDLIDAEAIEAVRQRLTRKTANGKVSMCYPLAVNNLLTKAMNQAADLGAPTVTAGCVAEC